VLVEGIWRVSASPGGTKGKTRTRPSEVYCNYLHLFHYFGITDPATLRRLGLVRRVKYMPYYANGKETVRAYRYWDIDLPK